jgi:hypothetical protein
VLCDYWERTIVVSSLCCQLSPGSRLIGMINREKDIPAAGVLTLIQDGFPSSRAPTGAAKANCGRKLGPSMATTNRPVTICNSPASLHEAPAANSAKKPQTLAKAPTTVDIWALHVSSQ